jgi:diguanylate cyclase (GGDEF)-like protein/PAS domain S-box-containing protein
MRKAKTNLQSTPSDPKSKTSLQTKIDEHKQDEKLQTKHRYLLNSLLDNLPEHIYFKDTESRFFKISLSLAKQFGLKDPSEAVGKTDYDFFSINHAQQAYENEKEIIRTGKTLSIEEKETWSDHPDTWVLTTKMPLYDEKEKIIGTFGISRDITDRKIAEENLRLKSKSLQKQIQEINLLHDQLRDLASRDALTGLSNRRMMNTILDQQFTLCQQFEQMFSIVIIDIDHFKNINDKYGHQVGDALLEEFGKCILASTRADDFSGRYGGDEILMAFQKMTVQQTLKKVEILQKKLGAIFILSENHRISTTVSIGIAAYPMHGNSVKKLINRADEALYIAKEKGRNQVVLASEEKYSQET